MQHRRRPSLIGYPCWLNAVPGDVEVDGQRAVPKPWKWRWVWRCWRYAYQSRVWWRERPMVSVVTPHGHGDVEPVVWFGSVIASGRMQW